MPPQKKKPAKKKSTASKKSGAPPKKVIAIRLTHDGAIYRGGPINAPGTLQPLLRLPSAGAAGPLTAHIKVDVPTGRALVNVAPQSWPPPRCVLYKTYLLGAFGLEKVKELGLWSVPSQGDVPIPRDMTVGFTNAGVLSLTDYVSNTIVNLPQWAGESNPGTRVSVYIALELDKGAKGSITITDPLKPSDPIVVS